MPNSPIYRLHCFLFAGPRLIWLLLLFLGFPIFGASSGIDIPLTIRETAGVPRHQWLITAGVPLPKGEVKTLEKLQIMDTQGRFIPAQFNIASRWWADGSIRWVLSDFAASVGAHSTATYFLREVASLPEFPSPIGLMPRGRDFEIITGPLRMVLLGNSNQLLDQVWVDEGWGYNFNETNKILDNGNFLLTLTCNGRTYHANNWKRGMVEVEMHNALRAVIKINGSFALAEQKEKKLDYIARITLYGGKTYFNLDLTVFDENPTIPGKKIVLEDLAIFLKLNLNPSSQRFTFGGTGEDYHGDFHEQAMASMYQFTSSQYRLFGAIEGIGPVDDNRAPGLGWVDLADDEYGLSVGVHWFSRLFPKGFEVKDDGTLVLKLFPSLAPPLEVPKGFCRTHKLLFHFHGKRDFALGQVKNVLLGFQSPIHATAPLSSYVRDFVESADLGESSDRDRALLLSLVPKYDAWLITNRNTTLAAMRDRDRGEASGLSCFGDSLHFLRNRKFFETAAGWQEMIGDFSHALYLHFFRSGDLQSLELAEQSVAFTADYTETHKTRDVPEKMSVSGQAINQREPLTSAEWRRFYQTEGLLDSYLLTGCLQSLEAARKSLQELLQEDKISRVPDAAILGNIFLCLARGYEVLGDPRLLERLNQLIDEYINLQKGDQHRQKESIHEAWKNGILWDGLLKAGQVAGRKVLLDQIIKEEAAVFFNREAEWNSESHQLREYPQLTFLLAQGLAAVDQDNHDVKYRDLSSAFLRSFENGDFRVEEPGTFGLLFGGAERFVNLIEYGRLKSEQNGKFGP